MITIIAILITIIIFILGALLTILLYIVKELSERLKRLEIALSHYTQKQKTQSEHTKYLPYIHLVIKIVKQTINRDKDPPKG